MKILFVTLSNIGDCILTLPVLDALRQKYPAAQISVLVPPRPRGIFLNNPAVSEVIIFDKHSRLKDKLKLFFALSKKNYDQVIDLRNSSLGICLPARHRKFLGGIWRRIPDRIKHMQQKHLFWAGLTDEGQPAKGKSIHITPADREYIQNILSKAGIFKSDDLIAIAPGARSEVKRWPRDRFSLLIRQLVQAGKRIVLVGDISDQPIGEYLNQANAGQLIDLCGKTTFSQLAALLEKAGLLITNDSAVMHLASYLNRPVVAIFGPTSQVKYGPWSDQAGVVKKDIFCRPCEKAQCRFGSLQCLTCIHPQDVLVQVKAVLESKGAAVKNPQQDQAVSPVFKRVLITRTDRLGDVLLSTPVIEALRVKLPQSYIAMLVTTYTQEVLEGNPFLDEVMAFDKAGQGRNLWAAWRLIKLLRQKKFDLAIILHPTNRIHWFAFLAGIPKRLGYDRKCGFLLTDRIKHDKQLGQKHESEYAMDLVRYLGITPQKHSLYMPVKKESEEWAKALFQGAGIKDSDRLLIIHPTASCPSRIWPPERFAQVADQLAQRYGFKIIIISGLKDRHKAEMVVKHMHAAALNLPGKTSLSQLASVLKRAQLFISTDSGPMHLAVALGVPVITIFGRSQAGLGPKRWGPLGERSRVLHKTVGCTDCFAHNCKKGFACLMATTVEDVLAAADSILKSS